MTTITCNEDNDCWNSCEVLNGVGNIRSIWCDDLINQINKAYNKVTRAYVQVANDDNFRDPNNISRFNVCKGLRESINRIYESTIMITHCSYCNVGSPVYALGIDYVNVCS